MWEQGLDKRAIGSPRPDGEPTASDAGDNASLQQTPCCASFWFYVPGPSVDAHYGDFIRQSVLTIAPTFYLIGHTGLLSPFLRREEA